MTGNTDSPDDPMNEPNDVSLDDRAIEALREFRAAVPAVTPDALGTARARLATHIDNASATPAVLALRPHHSKRRTPVALRWRIAASVAAAAVVAGGAYALTDDGHAPQPDAARSAPGSRSGTVTPSSTSPRVVHFVTASQVLDAAAAAAKDTPTPGPGQYLHVSSHSYDVTTIDDPPKHGGYQLTENRNDSWTSASGSGYQRNDNNIAVTYPSARDRRYAEASPGGIPERELTWYETAADGSTKQVFPTYEKEPPLQPCSDCGETSIWDAPADYDFDKVTRDPAKLRTSLYSWAKKMYRELVKYGKGDQFTVGDLAYDGVTSIATRPEIAGDLRAALYNVVKTIPGIKLIGSLANYDGTKGIAVGRVDTFHVQHDLIFTDNGSTYIGDRMTARAPSREFHVKAGTLLGASAVTVDITGKPDVPRRKK